ncbi:hypothetical protein OF83DRAFT_1086205 [Amylostereum chailletii]|nr:hypothetical protein OF83DRAFT_1086205 [Amylostereum chailletii]
MVLSFSKLVHISHTYERPLERALHDFSVYRTLLDGVLVSLPKPPEPSGPLKSDRKVINMDVDRSPDLCLTQVVFVPDLVIPTLEVVTTMLKDIEKDTEDIIRDILLAVDVNLCNALCVGKVPDLDKTDPPEYPNVSSDGWRAKGGIANLKVTMDKNGTQCFVIEVKPLPSLPLNALADIQISSLAGKARKFNTPMLTSLPGAQWGTKKGTIGQILTTSFFWSLCGFCCPQSQKMWKDNTLPGLILL